MPLRPLGVSGSGSHSARLQPAVLPGVPAPRGAGDPPAGTAAVRPGVRLGVDVGSVRVGVARSDPGGVLASPLTVLRSGPGAKDELVMLAAGAIEVIVGLPTSLSGREGKAAAGARTFAADLAERLPPP